MKTSLTAAQIFDQLVERRSDLASCRTDFLAAFDLLQGSYARGGKLLLAGNGGSAADAEHIAGELLKGFRSTRPLSEAKRQALRAAWGEAAEAMISRLEEPLPAIALTSHPAFGTAFGNDASAEWTFAQHLLGLGRSGDVFLAISTSGRSRNILHAARLAKAFGMAVIGFTGRSGGDLLPLCDVCLRVEQDKVFLIQEGHLPLYHALCWALEEHFFPGTRRDV